LAGFLRALGLEGATVIGHSMGGAAAWLLAGREPGLIGRLVLEEAPPLIPLDPPRPPAERTDEEPDFDWPVIPDVNDDLNAPDPDWQALLPRITAPTLLVGGGPGGPFPQEQMASMAGRIPDARMVTIEAGHLVHHSRPAEFLAALEEFGI
ncbi:alpha/beta hydrolase, partial [Streptomyces sp. T-3]|nr:alpha/beta hydrolase [Streptomyces sp. T-3]